MSLDKINEPPYKKQKLEINKFSEIITDKPVYLKVYGTDWYLTYGEKILHSSNTRRRKVYNGQKKDILIYFEKNKKTLWIIEEIYKGYYGIRAFDKEKENFFGTDPL